jgi:hypothetical protein
VNNVAVAESSNKNDIFKEPAGSPWTLCLFESFMAVASARSRPMLNDHFVRLPWLVAVPVPVVEMYATPFLPWYLLTWNVLS